MSSLVTPPQSQVRAGPAEHEVEAAFRVLGAAVSGGARDAATDAATDEWVQRHGGDVEGLCQRVREHVRTLQRCASCQDPPRTLLVHRFLRDVLPDYRERILRDLGSVVELLERLEARVCAMIASLPAWTCPRPPAPAPRLPSPGLALRRSWEGIEGFSLGNALRLEMPSLEGAFRQGGAAAPPLKSAQPRGVRRRSARPVVPPRPAREAATASQPRPGALQPRPGAFQPRLVRASLADKFSPNEPGSRGGAAGRGEPPTLAGQTAAPLVSIPGTEVISPTAQAPVVISPTAAPMVVAPETQPNPATTPAVAPAAAPAPGLTGSESVRELFELAISADMEENEDEYSAQTLGQLAHFYWDVLAPLESEMRLRALVSAESAARLSVIRMLAQAARLVLARF
jgi:hypothetical protein